MRKLENISGNDLSELTNLMYRIKQLIDSDFCHVHDLIPSELRNKISEYREQLNEEWNQRERP
jgi:hypothetical protein